MTRIFILIIVAGILAGSVISQEKIKLVADHDAFTDVLPLSDDGFLDQIRENPNLIWYDRKSIPPLHQHWRPADLGSQHIFGVVPDKENISAEPTEPHGNPNREFPWLLTAGTDDKTHIANFAIIPKKIDLKWEEVTGGNYRKTWPMLKWTYPEGTIFGEVIFVVDYEGNRIPCEVRIRRKAKTGWLATAYRPFPTSDDLRDACLDISKEDREILINAMDQPTTKTFTMKNNHPNLTVIEEKATLEFLPEVNYRYPKG